SVTLDFIYNTETLSIGFVTNGGNALDFFLVDKFRRPLNHIRFVDLIGDFGDDNPLPSVFEGLNFCFSTHHDTASARFAGIFYAIITIYNTSGSKFGPFDVLHQFADFDITVVYIRYGAVHDFGQIVRSQISGHTYRNSGCSIHQKIRDTRRKYGEFL